MQKHKQSNNNDVCVPRVHEDPKRCVQTKTNPYLQITQDDDDGDTLAPTALYLPGIKWGGNEDNKDAPPTRHQCATKTKKISLS